MSYPELNAIVSDNADYITYKVCKNLFYFMYVVEHTVCTRYVTGPTKIGHVGTNYTPLLYRSCLSIGKVYFHSVTCIIIPIKVILCAENCNAIT